MVLPFELNVPCTNCHSSATSTFIGQLKKSTVIADRGVLVGIALGAPSPEETGALGRKSCPDMARASSRGEESQRSQDQSKTKRSLSADRIEHGNLPGEEKKRAQVYTANGLPDGLKAAYSGTERGVIMRIQQEGTRRVSLPHEKALRFATVS